MVYSEEDEQCMVKEDLKPLEPVVPIVEEPDVEEPAPLVEEPEVEVPEEEEPVPEPEVEMPPIMIEPSVDEYLVRKE